MARPPVAPESRSAASGQHRRVRRSRRDESTLRHRASDPPRGDCLDGSDRPRQRCRRALTPACGPTAGNRLQPPFVTAERGQALRALAGDQASSPAWSTAVFTVNPLKRWASVRRRSSMLRVVRICINVPSRCRSVNRASGRSLLRPPTRSCELDDPDKPVGRRSPPSCSRAACRVRPAASPGFHRPWRTLAKEEIRDGERLGSRTGKPSGSGPACRVAGLALGGRVHVRARTFRG